MKFFTFSLRFIFFLAFVALLLPACGPDYLIREKKSLPESGWSYADSLSFPFEVRDTNQLYDLELLLKHSPDFPFQNLYVRIHTLFPDGQRLSKVLSLELADKLGLWQGECSGKSCSLEIPLQQGTYFNQMGKYEVVFEQFMRSDSLPGLESMEFRVVSTERSR